MKLYNTLTKQIDEFIPVGDTISMYSCGPTVYNNLHIGNLSAFVYADLLRRVLTASFPDHKVRHVMNITDVDDKTIRDSKDSDKDPMQALLMFTRKYEQVFMDDMAKIGNDLSSMEFIRATDTIEDMLAIIRELYDNKIAYIADDGVYFSIAEYKKHGKKYGQLVHIDESSTSSARIQNDEYDKESAHDFALWKLAKEGEPSWAFELDGQQLTGRPGWHIECSAMSRKLLGQPFDIHTGGIDLKFPHHENEIAQSTACTVDPLMAQFFVHNEHVLVDGTKMSKSLGNFFTLRDLEEKGFDSLSFRLLTIQGHYRSQVNFSWENLESAQNRLRRWRNIAALRWQDSREYDSDMDTYIKERTPTIANELSNDLNVSSALKLIEDLFDRIEDPAGGSAIETTTIFYETIDLLLGIQLLQSTPDINESAKELLEQRKQARINNDWPLSDSLRDELKRHGIDVRDDKIGQTWSYATGVIETPYFCL